MAPSASRSVRLDINEKVIRRARGQRRLPFRHELGAYRRQEQQHHQADAESHDLNAAFAAAASDVRNAVAPRDTDAAAHAAARARARAAREVQREERHDGARQQIRDELEVAEQERRAAP